MPLKRVGHWKPQKVIKSGWGKDHKKFISRFKIWIVGSGLDEFVERKEWRTDAWN